MINIEELRYDLNKKRRKAWANVRNKKLKNKDFTIISNNCWGGMIYEVYGLQKTSPFVGLFILSDDYINIISNLKEYMSKELVFIDIKDSKHKEYFGDKINSIKYPVGLLGDAEVYFMHYHSKEEAKEKWERRVKRINYDNLIVKFNDQNLCDEKYLEKFLSLPYKNKLFFTSKKWGIKDKAIHRFFQFRKLGHIDTINEPYFDSFKFNVTRFINKMKKESE